MDTAIKFDGKEIQCIDDYDVFSCYKDLWKTKYEKKIVSEKVLMHLNL